MPIHTNGWISLGLYLLLLATFHWPMQWWLGYNPNSLQRLTAIVALTIPFGLLTWRKTEGGWGRREQRYEDE